MNPQDQNQPQNQPQQQDQNQPAIPDSQVDDKFIMENAQQMLADEAANPGSQDPGALQWARGIVGNPSAAVSVPAGDVQLSPDVPVVADQQPGQTIQPTPTEQAASADGHVLYIDRSQEQQPPQDNNQPNNGGQEQS
jgi:hypothetical protein